MLSTTYLSYIVRVWRERSLDHPTSVAPDWQGEIEHIQTGERWSFANMDELLAFLRHQTERPDSAN